jgi:predicted ABC-type ATPase
VSTQSRPTFILLAGPNGAGKTSYYETVLRTIPEIARLEFVNADAIAQGFGSGDPVAVSERARLAADARRAALIAASTSFCSETVFSHPSKVELIRQAQSAEFEVVLVFVCVESPALSAARVSFRVAGGLGHDVPYEKIVARYARAVAHAGEAVSLADYAVLIDNSRIAEPWRVVMTFEHGEPAFVSPEIPGWAEPIAQRLARSDVMSGSPRGARRGPSGAIVRQLVRPPKPK